MKRSTKIEYQSSLETRMQEQYDFSPKQTKQEFALLDFPIPLSDQSESQTTSKKSIRKQAMKDQLQSTGVRYTLLKKQFWASEEESQSNFVTSEEDLQEKLFKNKFTLPKKLDFSESQVQSDIQDSYQSIASYHHYETAQSSKDHKYQSGQRRFLKINRKQTKSKLFKNDRK